MNGSAILLAWSFYPSVIIGCILALVGYFWTTKWKLTVDAFNFTLGVLCIFIALCSPLDALSDDYLFSAHMLQHMLLALVAPAYMVSALPQAWVRTVMKIPFCRLLERILGHPILALAIAVTVFWIWHLPVLYNATIENEGFHVFEHLTFLVSGFILWWPVWKPIEGRLTPSVALVYVFTAAVAQGLIGIIFSIADTPYYSVYAHPHDQLGILPLLREKWGLTQLSDQKLGGAIMWGFGSVIYLWALMAIMIRWFYEYPENEAPHSVRKVVE
ncbi:MAG TPA: cytochrome c oxidase assembly protein [Candidatus Obscuribacterales bacterium]